MPRLVVLRLGHPDGDLYAHHYLSRAMFQRGTKAWNEHQSEVLASLPACNRRMARGSRWWRQDPCRGCPLRQQLA